MKKQSPKITGIPADHTTSDKDYRASEENPVDETMEEMEAGDRADFDNNPETSGKPIVPDRPADPVITSDVISDYIPGQELDTPNENQRTVAAKQFGATENAEKSTGYKDFIHPSAHNSVTGSQEQGDQQPSDENQSSDAS